MPFIPDLIYEDEEISDVNFKDFYDILRENLNSYEEEYDKFIDFGPDLYKLLTEVLNVKEVKPEIRLKACAAIAYYVAPFDIIPETIYGPKGYIDDIFVCAYVLKEIINEMDYEFLEELWESEEDLQYVLDESYTKSKEVVDDKIDVILKYIGLKI
jgi:uncharacterized membrane protein YkvA (DUF1232 family)